MNKETSFFISTVLILFSLCSLGAFNILASTYEERKMARAELVNYENNNNTYIQNIEALNKNVSKANKQVTILEAIRKESEKAISTLMKINTHLNSSKSVPSMLNELVKGIEEWKKNNPSYKDYYFVSELVTGLDSLNQYRDQTSNMYEQITSWVKTVLGANNIETINKLLDESTSEVADTNQLISKNYNAISSNNARIEHFKSLAILPAIRKINTRDVGGAGASGAAFCYWQGGFNCVYTEFAHNCTSPVQNGENVWCLQDEPNIAEETITGTCKAQVRLTNDNNNPAILGGEWFCGWLYGSSTHCVYTSLGRDCSSPLKLGDYVYCMNVN